MTADKDEIVKCPNLIDQNVLASLLLLRSGGLGIAFRFFVCLRDDSAEIRVLVPLEPAARWAFAAGTRSLTLRILAKKPLGKCGRKLAFPYPRGAAEKERMRQSGWRTQQVQPD
jgi:hypothetical protein